MEKDIHLYPAERHQQILTMLSQNGRATVTELSEKFGVSEVTIRNDLQTLAGQSLVFDHRMVDGSPAARFLQVIKNMVEEPYLLLTS
jgi:pyruvate/2-oxoglutarate dehydrogenase complex dihydrolipoamide acyltransferase (E2) component